MPCSGAKGGVGVKNQRWIAYGLATTGVMLILAGLARSEATEVMQKATMICLECIGLR